MPNLSSQKDDCEIRFGIQLTAECHLVEISDGHNAQYSTINAQCSIRLPCKTYKEALNIEHCLLNIEYSP